FSCAQHHRCRKSPTLCANNIFDNAPQEFRTFGTGAAGALFHCGPLGVERPDFFKNCKLVRNKLCSRTAFDRCRVLVRICQSRGLSFHPLSLVLPPVSLVLLFMAGTGITAATQLVSPGPRGRTRLSCGKHICICASIACTHGVSFGSHLRSDIAH